MTRHGPRPRRTVDAAAAERFMRLAVAEAAQGVGRTHPNPAVGAVVVREGRVVGRGHHAHAGGPHAEVVALRAAGSAARGADLYTTLEPCDHWGKTPPCSIAILEGGVRRVFVGSRDPNPVVNGRGVARLRRAGVEVATGVLREVCDAVNAPWFHFIRTGRPFVTLKAAVTLDGRIAAPGGDARWVTGPAARAEVHRLRDRVDAVLVGAGTARIDDPLLTTRLPAGRGRDAVRVVLDTGGVALPDRLRVLRPRSSAPTLLATAVEGRAARPGVEILRCRATRGGRGAGPRVDVIDLLRRLGLRGITHLLVEGGAATHASFLAAGAVEEIVLYVAPKILGGGTPWLDTAAPARMADALTLSGVEVRRVGDDLVIKGRPLFARVRRRRRR